MKENRFRVCENCAARRGLGRGGADQRWLVGEDLADEVTTYASHSRLCDDCNARVTHFWLLDRPGPFRGGPKGTKKDRVSVQLRLTQANIAWLRAQAGAQRGRSMADVVNELLDAARKVS